VLRRRFDSSGHRAADVPDQRRGSAQAAARRHLDRGAARASRTKCRLMGLVYISALLVALTGMVLLDRRFQLFFWRDAARASAVLVLGVLFFLVWDLFGIGLGIFFRGETAF